MEIIKKSVILKQEEQYEVRFKDQGLISIKE